MNTYEPPIFVMGLPRTGSTLLENIIGRSPGVLELAEVLYLSPWRRDFRYFLRTRVGDPWRDENLRKMVEIIFSEHDPIPGITGSFWRMGGGIKAIGESALKERVLDSLKASDRSLASILRILLKEITLFNDCRKCSVAFPVYISHLGTLLEWFPDARVIHIARDPRAIAISKTNDPGGTALYNQKYPYLKFFIRKAMIAFVIVQYIWASRVHAKFRDQPNYLLVKYEDFIMDPEATVKRVCEFAKIGYNPEMLEQSHDRAQRSSISGEVRTKADARAALKWMNVITPFEKFLVTFLCKRGMARFGFDPDSHPVYAGLRPKDPAVRPGLSQI
jgi:sulfotransferase family protein